jgi:hypothetical protein
MKRLTQKILIFMISKNMKIKIFIKLFLFIKYLILLYYIDQKKKEMKKIIQKV